MIVRRYVVKDMPEAVVSIRKELGKDAVILSTKKIRVRKWLGLRWQTRIEVTAAAGSDIPLAQQVVMERRNTTGTDPVPRVQDENTQGLAQDAMAFTASMRQAAAAYQSSESKREYQNVERSMDLSVVLQELAALKTLLAERREPALTASDTEGRTLEVSLQAYLEEEGIQRQHGKRWAQTMLKAYPHVSSLAEALPLLARVIISDLAELSQPAPIRKESRVVAFIGPTGVGKTTTIAKIAALHVLAGQRRVGLLTTDTFRIAAVQQLQTYAEILNVPLAVADGDDELSAALAELEACDLILVDTAGRNFRKQEVIESTRRLLRSIEPDEVVLVLALTSKASDCRRVAELCKPLGVDKLVFTKLDETQSVGVIPDLVATFETPVACVTTGQNVPDDIDIISIEQLLSRWQGGEGDG
ncbi:flagellar biosynthesis regulator FlhF [Alicyclobacillus hesperidum subsp. aegles]|uniref:flagellar biosynthesis protein FlhF n=1 Tax=Alicyclobacillus hesperidum TaxID=89784 RepID=UPI0022294237|nr:flagellar biosynthesis protein FlhF [Alicyclobacillus hesperidum]GLG00579.1 flagellar biosynthesis regulator FlhF [Alicyclobacillus hesperidum subsp. aegles]